MPVINYTYDNTDIKYVIETNTQMIVSICVACRQFTCTRLFYQFPLREDYADFSMTYCIECAEIAILMELLGIDYTNEG